MECIGGDSSTEMWMERSAGCVEFSSGMGDGGMGSGHLLVAMDRAGDWMDKVAPQNGPWNALVASGCRRCERIEQSPRGTYRNDGMEDGGSGEDTTRSRVDGRRIIWIRGMAGSVTAGSV